MKSVYFLSGLGADERIFSKLQIPDTHFQFVKWVPPIINETIADYANRLKEQIKDENPVLVGLSFGGIMAIEISKIIRVEKTILIASVKSHKEVPRWMKICGEWKLDRMLPSSPLKSIKSLKAIRPIQNYFLGAHSTEEKMIANEFRDNIDPFYLRWSVHQVLNWKNDWQPETLFHIHGDNDHIFPIKKVNPTHIIPKAGHFMVMNRFKEINNILAEII